MSVAGIQEQAFASCKNVIEVIFEEDSVLTKIDKGAFENCTNLKIVEFPNNLQEIGIDAFKNCDLESFVAPKSLRALRQGAFQNCKSLKRVRLNEGLEDLGTNDRPD